MKCLYRVEREKNMLYLLFNILSKRANPHNNVFI